MGLDDRRQATGRDSGECPETVTHILFKVLFVRDAYLPSAQLVFMFVFVIISNSGGG